MPQKLSQTARSFAALRHQVMAVVCLFWMVGITAAAFSGVSAPHAEAHPVVHHVYHLARYAARAAVAATVRQQQVSSAKHLHNAIVRRTTPGKHAFVFRRSCRLRRDRMGGLVYGTLPQKRGPPSRFTETTLAEVPCSACPSPFVCPSFSNAPSRAPPLV